MTHSSSHRSPAEILMHAGNHRAAGGSMPSNEPSYSKRGGSQHPKSYMRNGRHCHAEGDTVGEMGVNPVNGYEYPGNPENKRRGGRARHAEGDTVYAEGDTVEHDRHGGRARRRHHSEGGETYNEGGDVYAEGGDTSDHLRRGGRARRHRSEGGDVDREHHNFGDVVNTVGKGVSTVLPFLSMLLKKGGSAHHKRRRHHSEGDTVEHDRHGGRARRRHHSEGDEVPLNRAMGGAGKVRKGMMRSNGSLV
jgi:hypothetical protein